MFFVFFAQNQVRSELDILHAVKQSMSKRMEENHRKLAETVNIHLSSHTKQMSQVESVINR